LRGPTAAERPLISLPSRETPAGKTSLREWLVANRERVGLRYAAEIEPHFQPSS